MSLVDDLIQTGVLTSPRLIEAFRAADRKYFVLDDLADFAYRDEPLPIGDGQTISQPWTVAFMLELLDPKPGENILEIGYGSGWQTALLAYCIGRSPKKIGSKTNTAKHGTIYTIERIPQLCKFGKSNIERLSKNDTSFSFDAIQFFCQDGSAGLPEVAKRIGSFDKIIVSAALQATNIPPSNRTADYLPQAWKEQLKTGGRIIVPIDHSLFLFIKKTHNQFNEQKYPGFAFVPLVGKN